MEPTKLQDVKESDSSDTQNAEHPAEDPRSLESRVENAQDQLTHAINAVHGSEPAVERELREAYEACSIALKRYDGTDERVTETEAAERCGVRIDESADGGDV